MTKPSYFRTISIYLDIAKAQSSRKTVALKNKYFKIKCLSPLHDDKSEDSLTLPKESRYISSTGNSGKTSARCYSCNNNSNWKEYTTAIRNASNNPTKENLEKAYELIENRYNADNPVEFFLKVINKYDVNDSLLKNFYENKSFDIFTNDGKMELKPNELMEISVQEFNELVHILKDTKQSIGEKTFKTLYLYENETPVSKAKRILDSNKKYINETDTKELERILEEKSKKKEDLLKIKIIENKISQALKKEWQEKEQQKSQISEYIVSFYKTNGKPSPYYLKRGMSEKVLKDSDVLEIDKTSLITLKRELFRKYGKEILFESGILANFDGKETFVFETHPIIVPLKTSTYLRGIQYRCDAKKDSEAAGGTRFKTIGSKNSNYWENNVEKYEKIIVTEGYSDAMSVSSILEKLGMINIKVIGVANATNSYNRTLNSKFKNKSIYKLLDNDSAGKSATKKLFNEMINGLQEGEYKFKDISTILKSFKDFNEYYLSTDLEIIKKELTEILNSNDEKEIKLLSKIPDNGKILDDKTILDLENMSSEMYTYTDAKKVLKLDVSQQIELLFESELSITNKNYTPDDIKITNNFIYDKELYDGYKILSELFKKDINFESFINSIKENNKILRMFSDVKEEEFNLIKKEFKIINEIELKTNIKDLDIFQYFTNMNQPIEYMTEKKIPFTLRGSAGASVILSRQIRMINNTNAFDPVAHSKFIDFERFMNIDRKDSLPDIDIDVSSEHREEIRKYCGYYIPKTKSGQKHLSRSYPISIKLNGKELTNKELPLSDRYLEKFYPSFDILAMSMQGIEEIFDFTKIENIDKDSFIQFYENYLHIDIENGSAGEIYKLIKDELKTTEDFISLLALNKTPFNANNFEFVRKYVKRLKNREENQTGLEFLKNTNGFIIYQEQLLEFLTLLNISGNHKQKIRKLNSKPHQVTEEKRQEIEDLYKEVEEAVNNYQGENKEEISEIFKNQYINLKYNAYIFNFPHSLAYHNVNMNIYFNKMNALKKRQKETYRDEDFSQYKKDLLNIADIKKKTEFLTKLKEKYRKLNILELEQLILLETKDYEKLLELKRTQQNKKFPVEMSKVQIKTTEKEEKEPEQDKHIGKEEKIIIKKETPKNTSVIKGVSKTDVSNLFEEENIKLFKEKKAKTGQKYFIMNKKFNKLLEKETALLKIYKYKIRFFENTGMFTIWDEEVKKEIEKRFNEYNEKANRQDILKSQINIKGNKTYILNKKFNSLMYKLVKERKFKNVTWNSPIKSWEIEDKETKKEVIKYFVEFLKKEPDFLTKEKKSAKREELKFEIIKEKDQTIIKGRLLPKIEKFIQTLLDEDYEYIKKSDFLYIQTSNLPEEDLEYNLEIIKKIEISMNNEQKKEEPKKETLTEREEFEEEAGEFYEEESENIYEEEPIEIDEPTTINENWFQELKVENLTQQIINLLNQLKEDNYKHIIWDGKSLKIQIKGENISEDDKEYNQLIITGINALNNKKEAEEAHTNLIKIETTSKWIKITGDIDEQIIKWIKKTLIDKGYKYIKLDDEDNLLIQIADYNEIGRKNLDFNFKILEKIKTKMNYKEEKENRIIIKQDKKYIKIKGELPADKKTYLLTLEENNIYYHKDGDFWTFLIEESDDFTKEQVDFNLKIVEQIKKSTTFELIQEKTTTSQIKKP